jgi:hypothetical protein
MAKTDIKFKGNKNNNWLRIVIPVIVISVIFAIYKSMTTPNPKFPSLADNPDTALTGTVAYYDNPSRCIKVISASGAKSKELMCMAEFDKAKAETEGKPVGWNITWRSDNRLEITEFLMMTTGSSPTFKPSWQKVVDVVTGETVDVPAAQISKKPTAGKRKTISSNGSKISFTSDSGHGVVTLTKSGKDRVLLDVQGNPETYRINGAHWSADYKWVAVDDGRLLITTIDDPSVTRALTPALETDYGYDELHWYDITKADLLK